MIKLIGLMNRKDGRSLQEFQRYWREVHAPLIAQAPGLRRYIQSHSVPELYDQYPQAFDGMAEAWFDSPEAYGAAIASPAWQAAVADGPNFIGSSRRLLATEVPIIDAYGSTKERAGMVKYAGFLTHKDGLSVEAMQQHWREVHGPLVVKELTTMVRYVQCHAITDSYRGPNAFDGVPEAWFASLETFPMGLGRRGNGPPTSVATRDSHTIFEQPIPSMVAREVVIVDAA